MFENLFVKRTLATLVLARAAWLVVAIFVVASATQLIMLAQGDAPEFYFVREVEADELVLEQPVGLAYSTRSDNLYLLEQSDSGATQSTLQALSPFGEARDSVVLAVGLADAINLVYDSRYGRLLLFDSGSATLWSVNEDAAGGLDPQTLTSQAVTWGVSAAQGLAVDGAQGTLYLLDGVGPRLVQVQPGEDGSFAQATVTVHDWSGLPALRGLAWEPSRGHLFAGAPQTQQVVEVTVAGEVVAVRELAPLEVGASAGLVFAPSADLTDAPEEMHLYVAESGAAAGEASGEAAPAALSAPHDRGVFLPRVQGGSGEVDEPRQGRIVELSLEPAPPMRGVSEALIPSLVQTIDASQWSPPSPDTSGIVYLPHTGQLLVSDGEVNETALYAGVNMWHITLGGAVVETWTTLVNPERNYFSDEPTGVAVNPDNQHLFISDDAGTRSVYEVDPGPDGVYGSGDDVVSSLKTNGFGSRDPEDVAYAAVGSGLLYIVDGVNREVYRLTPGENGRFDGVPPLGDDEVSSFDTEILGLLGPEGIAYSPDSGTLFLVGAAKDLMIEVTQEGDLVETYDIGYLGARNLAGLAYAPSSQEAHSMSIYLVDRGIDNDTLSDQSANDGKIYEVRLPNRYAPVANDDTIEMSARNPATIQVAANDADADGNLDPGSASIQCAICAESSFGSLTNRGDGTFVYTPTIGFHGVDSFIYEICDTGLLCDTATVSITVMNDTSVYLPLIADK